MQRRGKIRGKICGKIRRKMRGKICRDDLVRCGKRRAKMTWQDGVACDMESDVAKQSRLV
jgi:hypothetical protein